MYNWQVDMLTSIGIVDANKLLDNLAEFKEIMQDQLSINRYSIQTTRYNPFDSKFIIKPLDDSKRWYIHYSYGDFTKQQIKDMDSKFYDGESDFDSMVDLIKYQSHSKYRLQTNPSKGIGDDLYYDTLEFLGIFSKHTHNSRVDIAIDYKDSQLLQSQLVDLNKYHRELNIIYSADVDRQIQTRYLGKRNSRIVLVQYNKTIEQRQKGLDIEDNITRCECRFNSKPSCNNFMTGLNPYDHVKFTLHESVDFSKLQSENPRVDMAKLLSYYHLSKSEHASLAKDMLNRNTITRYNNLIREYTVSGLAEDVQADYESIKNSAISQIAEFNSRLCGSNLNI